MQAGNWEDACSEVNWHARACDLVVFRVGVGSGKSVQNLYSLELHV